MSSKDTDTAVGLAPRPAGIRGGRSHRRPLPEPGKKWALASLLVLLFALLLGLGAFAPTARAELSRAGPLVPDTGFPAWIEDSKGLRLEPCFSGAVCSATAPDPSLPPSTPDNIGDRVVYWAASATMPTRDGGRASLSLTTQGGFLPSREPKTAAQQVLNRIHIQVDNPVPGATYRVTHPYGVETFTDVDGGRRGIDFTEEVGCLQAPCGDFAASLNGRVGPWLTWDEPGSAPAGYVGDGQTPHRVTGSVINDPDGDRQNYFEIEGPDIGGPGKDVVRTDLFVVEGKISGLAAFAQPRGGFFDADRSVTLTASDPTARIFYTTDGSEPTPQSTPYDGPVPVTSTTMLRFVALEAASSKDRTRSPVVTETYTLED